jgi:hypothetical protein
MHKDMPSLPICSLNIMLFENARLKDINAHVIYTKKSEFIKNEHAGYTFERFSSVLSVLPNSTPNWGMSVIYTSKGAMKMLGMHVIY